MENLLHDKINTVKYYKKVLTFSKEELEEENLPKRKSKLYCLLKHPIAMPYNRLILLMIILNIFSYMYFFANQLVFNNISLMNNTFNMIVLNFSIAIFIRQQYVINALFKLATKLPSSLPLWLRWTCGKIYHFGGIHVGTYFSASIWLFFLCYQFSLLTKETAYSILFQLTFIHAVILLFIMLVSLPKIREKYHNQFEIIARLGNWLSLALFWAETIIFLQRNNSPILLSPYTGALLFLTFHTVLPWLRLKKVPIDVQTPSKHVALASFKHLTPFEGSSTDISWSPLLEWHSFANVPAPNKKGFRLTISRAGDWTSEFIEKKPRFIWVKGVPTAGVGNIETLFKRVIWIATGSGVGPCIPHLLTKKVPSRLIWSTRSPRDTYGDKLVDEILEVQAKATIWDTTLKGKPNLVKLAYQAYREFNAEAIICISNKKTTWDIVYEFESRGIPAFGAIWDS